jgi:hypothetical protein
MKAIITRNMNVMNAGGENEAYLKSPKPVELDIGTYQRLNRAGAAILHVEDEPDPEPVSDIEAMTKEQLVSYAETNTITIDASAKKADILAAIKVHQANTTGA